MKKIVATFLLLFSTLIYSQVKVSGVVQDEQGQPIAFANLILKNSIQGTVSDENGKFYLESEETYKELEVSFLGFEKKIIPLKSVNYNLTIVLKEAASSLDEVVIYTGKVKKKGNPAIAILRKIWKKKRKNGLYMYKEYQYDKYEKIEFDVNNIDDKFKKSKLFKGMEFIFDEVDTSSITGKTYLPIFINEALYKTYGKNRPKREREELIANKNSGFDNNQNIIEFIKQLQVEYNIYSNYLKFFDKSFTSPLSRTGPSVYNYVLTDSAFIDNKWCYNIIFYPRRKNELTFKGNFWVNDSTYAVKEFQMAATRSANVNWVKEIYLEQEFDVLNDSIFLLKRDHMMSDFSLRKKDEFKGVYGRRTTMYDNFKFDEKKEDAFYLKRLNNYNKEVFNRSNDYWSERRMERLNDNEESVYKMLDTLQTVKRFRQLYDVTATLASGYWLITKGFDLGPIYSIVGSNDIEGTRFRIGGRSYFTHDDKFRAEGFVAYGLQDKKFKHGISAKWMIDPKYRFIVSGGNRKDVEQTGVLTTSNSVLDRSFASAAFFSRGDNSKLTNMNLSNFAVEMEPMKNFKVKVGATYKTMVASDPTRFNIGYLAEDGSTKASIEQVELDVAVAFTPRKKTVGFGVERDAVNAGRYPIIYLSYTKGLKDVLNSDFDYHKLQLFYQHRIQVGGIGKLKYVAEVGKTFNAVPLSLMDIVPGNQSPLMTKQTFDLLDYYEFITDQYATLHVEHNFNGRLFSRIPLLRKLNLREIVGARAVIGTVSDRNRAINLSEFSYRAPEKPYWEYHAGVGNIFKLVRVDFIFRGNYKELPEATNFAVKAGINFEF
jgi:hypothetical protein